jgi:hypothetical protein
MLPLSYSVILGGTVTTIGTSTNLVATGLYATKLNSLEKTTKYNANNVLNLFEMGKIGLPVLLAGIAYIVIVSPLLFKGRRVKPWNPEHVKTYSLHLSVGEGCGLFSKTVTKSGLLNLSATLVAHFRKDGQVAMAAEDSKEAGAPTTTATESGGGIPSCGLDLEAHIQQGDVLVFRCEVHMLPELMRFQGLNFAALKVKSFPAPRA